MLLELVLENDVLRGTIVVSAAADVVVGVVVAAVGVVVVAVVVVGMSFETWMMGDVAVLDDVYVMRVAVVVEPVVETDYF